MVQKRCVDCDILSVEASSDYTLIGAAHAWRVSRGTGAAGEVVFEWRCPACWQRHKERKGETPAAPAAGALPRPQRSATPSGQYAAVMAGKLFDKARDSLANPKTKRPR